MNPPAIATPGRTTVVFLHKTRFFTAPLPFYCTFCRHSFPLPAASGYCMAGKGALVTEQDTFQQRIWQIVAAIPTGKVTTYGDVARLAGSPRAARQVGGVLKRLPAGSRLPWHRVINRSGEISLKGSDLDRQRNALLAEGVEVDSSGKIALERYRWQG